MDEDPDDDAGLPAPIESGTMTGLLARRILCTRWCDMKKGGLMVGLLIKQRSRLQSQCEIINDTCTTLFREKIFYCSR